MQEQFLKDVEECYHDMPDSQKKVAQYLIRNYEHAAFLTLDQLAVDIGVSTTTIIRFARNLGYSGFTDLLDHIQQIIKMKIGLPERLSLSIAEKNNDDLLVTTFKQDIENINVTLEGLHKEKLDEAIELISTATTVYVLGLRSSFSLAHFFAMVLGQIGKDVRHVCPLGNVLPEEILNVKEGDLCVVFSFSRYTMQTIETAEWMKKHGTTVLAVTDSLLSPVTEIADLSLPCQVKGLVFKNSLVAPLSLINYLIAAVALSDEETTMKNLSKNEELFRKGSYFAI